MMRGDEMISPLLQTELDERVQAANGDITAVEHELEEELRQLEENASMSVSKGHVRQDIALVLAELKYLDQELESESHVAGAEHRGFMSRMRHAFGSKD